MLTRVDPASDPVMSLALSSKTLSHAEISHIAEDQLADRFRAIAGVSTVDVTGARAAGITPVLLDVGDLYPDCDCLRVRSLTELVATL